MLVSRNWYDVARSDHLWRGMTLQYLGNCTQEKRGKKNRNETSKRKKSAGDLTQQLEKVKQSDTESEKQEQQDGFSYFRLIQRRVKECNALITSIKAEPKVVYWWQDIQSKRLIVRLIRWAAQYDYHVLLRKWISERFGALGSEIKMQDVFSFGLPADALTKAAKEGRLEIVKIFIEQGARHDTRDYRQNTLISLASRWGHVDIVKYLLRVGGLPPRMTIQYAARKTSRYRYNTREDYSLPAFHQAAQGGHVPVLQAYVDYLHSTEQSGLVPELLTHPTRYGEIPLHSAVSKGQIHAAEWLLAQIARVGLSPTHPKPAGHSLLSAAVASRKFDMVKFVLDNGLAFTDPDERGPFDACREAKFSIIELLLNHPSIPLGFRERLSVVSPSGHTLVWAALQRRPTFPRLVHYLIDNGADLRDALEALITGPYARRPCSIGILEKLLQRNLLPRPSTSFEPLHKHPLLLLLQCHPASEPRAPVCELVKMLLTHVDDIDKPMLLRYAMWWNDTIFRLVLATPGALRCLQHDPSVLRDVLSSRLRYSYEFQNLETLLKNLKEMDKEEVLREAPTYLVNSNIEALQLLVKYGASLETRDENGWTPMMLHLRTALQISFWQVKEQGVKEVQQVRDTFRGMGAQDLTVEDIDKLKEWLRLLHPNGVEKMLGTLEEVLGFHKDKK